MKRVLIISPNFPPVNAADIHRVRQSLPFFAQLGWEAVVVKVDEKFVESYSWDPLLLKSIPADVRIIKVKAFNISWTRKLGLGSLSIRSFWFYRKMGDRLLKKEAFDLVYFSTTAFHVLALGARWKRKFKVPFIVDIQDPWRRDYYLSKPKNERPKKFWLTYNIDKILEARTIPFADGIVSVSRGYCDTFLERYSYLKPEQCRVIPFAGAKHDFEIASKWIQSSKILLFKDKINVVYIGRGGHDLGFAAESIFKAIEYGLIHLANKFESLHFWFIGTSYAPTGSGKKTIEPVAAPYGLQGRVTEMTDRLPYFETLWLLQHADILLVPGSNDKHYTASKIYPYMLAGRPLITVFNENSSVVNIMRTVGYGKICTFLESSKIEDIYPEIVEAFVETLTSLHQKPMLNEAAFEPFTDKRMAEKQVEFFDTVVRLKN